MRPQFETLFEALEKKAKQNPNDNFDEFIKLIRKYVLKYQSKYPDDKYTAEFIAKKIISFKHLLKMEEKKITIVILTYGSYNVRRNITWVVSQYAQFPEIIHEIVLVWNHPQEQVSILLDSIANFDVP